MIRHLHPTDSPGLIVFRLAAPRSQAFTLARALQPQRAAFSLARFTGIALSLRSWQHCWVSARGARIEAVVRAGPRSGANVWEVRDVYLRSAMQADPVELLEQIAVQAGRSGARRIFLRTSASSLLFESARRAGFVSFTTETLYRHPGRPAAARRDATVPAIDGLRPRARRDAAALFRLYCGTTPLALRSIGAMTASDWAEGQESAGGRSTDWVIDGGAGAIEAWLRVQNSRSGRYVSAISAAPEHLAPLVQLALYEASSRPALALTKAHESALASALTDAGFSAMGTYEVLVKTLAQSVPRPQSAVAVA